MQRAVRESWANLPAMDVTQALEDPATEPPMGTPVAETLQSTNGTFLRAITESLPPKYQSGAARILKQLSTLSQRTFAIDPQTLGIKLFDTEIPGSNIVSILKVLNSPHATRPYPPGTKDVVHLLAEKTELPSSAFGSSMIRDFYNQHHSVKKPRKRAIATAASPETSSPITRGEITRLKFDNTAKWKDVMKLAGKETRSGQKFQL